jgi:hypothetical protein
MNTRIRTLFAGMINLLILSGTVAQAVTLHPGDILVSGTILVGNKNYGIVDINPTTGNRTIITDNEVGSGPSPPISSYNYLTLAPDGSILATDWGNPGQLYRIDPNTGNRTVISNQTVNSGPNNGYFSVQMHGNQILLGGNSLVSVDPITGDRTLVANVNPRGFSVVGDYAYVADGNDLDILKVNLLNGTSTILTGPGVGTGPSISVPVDVRMDLSGNLLVTTALQGGEIFSVDPLTGNRTIIAAAGSPGSGPPPSNYGREIGTASDGSVYVIGGSNSNVLRVDPTTGNRTIVSGNSVGSGPSFVPLAGLVVVPNVPEPSSITLLAIGGIGLAVIARLRFRLRNAKATLPILGLVVVLISSSRPALAVTLRPGDIIIGANIGASTQNPDYGLLEIDPTTGNRTLISDISLGSGPAFNDPLDTVTIQSDGSLLVTTQGQSPSSLNLYRVDPTSGNRTIISTAVGSSGPASDYVTARQFGSELLLSGGPIVAVDPATGNRTLISGTGLGTGPAFDSLGMTLSGGNLFVADTGGFTILKIDPSTGNRTVVSSTTVGTGPSFSEPGDVIVDPANGALLVEGINGSFVHLFMVDPVTGNRTAFSTSGPIVFPGQLGVASTGTVYTSGPSSSILQINPVSGVRSVLSDATHGTGPAFSNPATMALAVVPNVPEPSSIALLAIGAICLAGIARRACRLQR